MLKTLSKSLALAAVGSLIFAGSSLAAMITGGISINGGAYGFTPVDSAYSPESLDAATGIMFENNSFTVASVSGDFDLFLDPGDMGDIYDFQFAPLSGNTTPLWEITVAGPQSYSFDLLSISVDAQTSNFLVLSGSGIIHSTNWDDTVGEFILTANTSTQTFSWSASNGAVPEPTTMLLFGSGLIGLAAMRKKKNS